MKKENIIFLLILLAAIIIRFYFFIITVNSPVWWDEAEYLLKAKAIAFGTPATGWAPERELVVPIIFSAIFSIGLGETGCRILQLLISIGTVAMTYFVISKLTSKEIGLYAMFGMAFFWLHIFFTERVLLYLWAPLIFLSIVYFFYMAFIEKKNKHLIIFSIIAALGLMTYFSTGFLLVGLAIFLFMTEGFSLFKNKRAWLALVIFFLALTPYMIYSQITFGFPIPRMKVGVGAAIGEQGAGLSGVLGYITMFPSRVGWIFTILSVIGMLFFFFELFITYGTENWIEQNQNWILIFSAFFMTLFFYTLYGVVGGGGTFYDAFILPIFPFMFAFAGLILSKIFIMGKNYNENETEESASKDVDPINKIIIIIVILFVLGFQAYFGITTANTTIRGKVDSYDSVKLAGLWIKENSAPGDIIISVSRPQNTYYSERTTLGYPKTVEELENLIKEKHVKYIVLSIWEKHPDWAYSYPSNQTVIPVQGYYLKGTNQPSLAIYQPLVL